MAWRENLVEPHAYVAQGYGPKRAGHFVDRLELACRNLAAFPERVKRWDDIAPNLRPISLDRGVLMAFGIDRISVIALRVLYTGRDSVREDLPG